MPYIDKDTNRKYQLNRYHQRRRDVIILLGEECIKCGSKEKLMIIREPEARKRGIKTANIITRAYKESFELLSMCHLECRKCYDGH